MKANRLYQKYVDTVRPSLVETWKYENVHQVPQLQKIVIRMGWNTSTEKGAVDDAIKELTAITGRKPVADRARKSVANFKLRKGQQIGCHVTLRREVMFEFLDRLISTALPRIRDFRGISPKAFDGRGNYSIGVEQQVIFPEIDADKVKRTQGMDITIVTSAKTNAEALDLLKKLGMPFTGKQ
jgi:large subunit ribosomal protein L5